MEFKAEITYEKEDFYRWHKVYGKTNNKKRRRIGNIAFLVMSILVLVSAIFIVLNDGFDFVSAFCVVCFVIAAAVYAFRDRLNARISQKNFNSRVGMQYVTFSDEGMLVKNQLSEGKQYFGSITQIFEDSDRFYLLLDKRHALILPKKSIVAGDPDDFEAYISEKTGKEVVKIDCK